MRTLVVAGTFVRLTHVFCSNFQRRFAALCTSSGVGDSHCGAHRDNQLRSTTSSVYYYNPMCGNDCCTVYANCRLFCEWMCVAVHV